MSQEYYNKNADLFFKNTVDVDMSSLYEKFEKYLLPESYILDLGCGAGRDLKYFSNKGYKVLGIDYADELIKLAREYTGEKIIKMDFRDLNFKNEFDAIWACASLLHLKRTEIKDVLTRSFNALKKNGIMYMSFKYGKFEGIRNGRYFTFFDEELFDALLANFNNIVLLEKWVTQDLRKNRENEYWLNAIVKVK